MAENLYACIYFPSDNHKRNIQVSLYLERRIQRTWRSGGKTARSGEVTDISQDYPPCLSKR